MLEAPPIPSEEIASSPAPAGLDALLTTAAYAPLEATGFIRVTGEDRVRWLNGMVTNSIQALQPGEGCYNFFLSAQGRIQGDATAWMLEDCILLETAADRVPALIALLDRFIIMDDVELNDRGQAAGLLIAGPEAARILGLLGTQPPAATGLRLSHVTWRGEKLDLIQAHSPLVPRFQLWAAPETIVQLTEALASIPLAGAQDLEQLRLLEGTPIYGTDIRDRELPQETAQAGALHFSKGCYLGQEIVERIRSRGNVHRTFIGFLLDGPIPTAGTSIFAADTPDKAVGELTSAAEVHLPSGVITLALGYIRREALDRAQPLTYEGGTASAITLPFAALSLKP